MATATEIGEMVVTMAADASRFMRGMSQATVAAADTAQAVLRSGQQIEQVSQSLQGFAGAALAALGSLGAAATLRTSVAAFAEAEQAQIRLRAAVEQNGLAVGPVMEMYNAYAKSVRDSTGASVNATLALLRQAETHGLSGTAAIQAARGAAALAAATGTEASAMVRLTAALAAGDIARARMVSRYVPQLRGIKDENEFVARAQQLMATGLRTQAAIADSTQGVLDRFQATLKRVRNQLGEVVAEGLRPVVRQATQLLAAFGDMDTGSRRVVAGFLSVSAGVLAALPALSAFQRLAGLWVAPMLQAVRAVGSILSALASPLALVRGAVAVLGVVFSPVTLAVGAAAAGVALWVDHMGGLRPAWNAVRDTALSAWQRIREGGGQAWDWIKGKAADFLAWVQPALDVMRAAFGVTIEAIREYAGPLWSWLKDTAGDTLGKVVDWLGGVRDAVVAWAKVNADAVFAASALTGAVLAAYGAYRLIGSAVLTTAAVLRALGVTQAVTGAAWLAWRGVVLAVRGTLLVYHATLYAVQAAHTALSAGVRAAGAVITGVATAFQFAWATAQQLVVYTGLASELVMLGLAGVVGVVTLAYGAYTAATVAATGATAGLDAALAVTDALLGGLALALTAVFVAGPVIAFGAAVYAAYETAKGLWGVLSQLPTTSGPLRAIGDIFGGWYDTIRSVVRAAQVDMPLAWEILKAGASLAVGEVKLLWGPLWTFVKQGFKVVGEFVSETFRLKWKEALNAAGRELLAWGDSAMRVLGVVNPAALVGWNAVRGRFVNELAERERNVAADLRQAADQAQRHLQNAMEVFDNAEVHWSADMLEQWAELQEMLDEIPEAEARAARAATDANRQATQAAQQQLNAVNATNHAIERQISFHQALFRSAESLSRGQAYLDVLAGLRGGVQANVTAAVAPFRVLGQQFDVSPFNQPAPVETPSGSPQAAAGDRQREAMLALLRTMDDKLQRQLDRPPVVFQGLDLV